RQPLVLTEHHAFEDRAALAVKVAAERSGHPGMEAVGDAAESPAPSDLTPAVSAQDDVDPVATQPGALIEAALGPSGKREHTEDVQDGALGRGSPWGQLEQDGLVRSNALEAPHGRGQAKLEPRPARRPRDHDDRAASPSGLRKDDAPVDRVQARAPPPEPAEHERGEEQRQARAVDTDSDEGKP